MSQYRQNFLTKECVIIAPERAKRPDQFRQKDSALKQLPLHDPQCPFCLGNENKTPPPTLTINDGHLHYDHWRIIIIPCITTAAGFELGAGIYINVVKPEEGAAFLREVKVD